MVDILEFAQLTNLSYQTLKTINYRNDLLFGASHLCLATKGPYKLRLCFSLGSLQPFYHVKRNFSIKSVFLRAYRAGIFTLTDSRFSNTHDFFKNG